MKNKFKVATIVGTRPEIIRLSRIIPLLDIHCNHCLIHTGQNYDYELNEIFFKDLKLKMPDFYLNCTKNTISSSQVIGNIISYVDKILSQINPDAVLILGDTNSCLSAISAKKRKIPIFHIEAGNRCFDQRVPEEINRKIVDHISDINLTYSNISREYLIKEGFPIDQIIKIGSPMKEVLNFNMPKIKNSKILKVLKLKPKNYFLFSFHREENIDNKKNFLSIYNIINQLDEEFKIPIIVSTHPRTRKKIEENNLIFGKNVLLHKPFGFHDYINLQLNAKTVLSDSGTITEESSILNFAALNIRNCHERPEGMEEASVIMTGLDYKTISQSLKIIDSHIQKNKNTLNLVKDYSLENVSYKFLRILLSHINQINERVWKKN